MVQVHLIVTMIGWYWPKIDLIFFRYSFFIVLYPIGITGELICCYRALPHYSTTQSFSTALPNIWNFTFSFYYFTILIMVTYIPGIFRFTAFKIAQLQNCIFFYPAVFPQLYGHMFAQRRKVLAKKQD